MLVELENSYNGNSNELCHGTFALFPAETEKSFFLTFSRAGHTALKFINLRN